MALLYPYPFQCHGRAVSIGTPLFSLEDRRNPKLLIVDALRIEKLVQWRDKEFGVWRSFDEDLYLWEGMTFSSPEMEEVFDWTRQVQVSEKTPIFEIVYGISESAVERIYHGKFKWEKIEGTRKIIERNRPDFSQGYPVFIVPNKSPKNGDENE